MVAEIPHDAIREIRDRSWTARLIQIATGTGDIAERLRALETLTAVGDARSVAPLQAVADDPDLPDVVRLAAIEALAEVEPDATTEQREAWWASGDPVQQRRSLWHADRRDGERLLAVATDEQHPLRADALSSLAFGFDQPRFHAALIDALSADDVACRLTAAETLLWDQPVAAQDALLTAADDPDEAVALAAMETLGWYDSQAVLLGLHALAGRSERPVICATAEVTAERIATDLRFRLPTDPAARALAEQWLTPVTRLLPPGDQPLPDEARNGRPASASPRWTAGELASALRDDDFPRGPLERELHAEGRRPMLPESERAALRPQLLESDDVQVRAAAASVLRAWGDRAGLLDLVFDRHAVVRKMAMIELGALDGEPDPTIAALAWATADRTTGQAGLEALRAYARHGAPAEVRERLLGLAQADDRDDMRLAATQQLALLGAREELTALLPHLADPPRVTWSLHVVLLDAAVALHLPLPALDHLAEADCAVLQRSLAQARVAA